MSGTMRWAPDLHCLISMQFGSHSDPFELQRPWMPIALMRLPLVALMLALLCAPTRPSRAAQPTATQTHGWGVVEGFYWRPEHAVRSQYGAYSHEQRRRLISFMGERGLSVYVFDPKTVDRCDRALRIHRVGDLAQWKRTFEAADRAGVKVIWGVSPGHHTRWKGREQRVFATLDALLDRGLHGFALLMDDVGGAGTVQAQHQQAALLSELSRRHGEKLSAFCPASYRGDPSALASELQGIDRATPAEIPFVFTGRGVWNRSMSGADLPQLSSGRPLIVWDNWMASDTSDPARLELRPPLGRDASLFQRATGYWLNPVFPIERVIPVISGVADMARRGRSCNADELDGVLETMALDWAGFLGVSADATRAVLRTRLQARPVDVAALHGLPRELGEILPVKIAERLNQSERFFGQGFNLGEEVHRALGDRSRAFNVTPRPATRENARAILAWWQPRLVALRDQGSHTPMVQAAIHRLQRIIDEILQPLAFD